MNINIHVYDLLMTLFYLFLKHDWRIWWRSCFSLRKHNTRYCGLFRYKLFNEASDAN